MNITYPEKSVGDLFSAAEANMIKECVNSKSDQGHNHDDRYYTKGQTEALISLPKYSIIEEFLGYSDPVGAIIDAPTYEMVTSGSGAFGALKIGLASGLPVGSIYWPDKAFPFGFFRTVIEFRLKYNTGDENGASSQLFFGVQHESGIGQEVGSTVCVGAWTNGQTKYVSGFCQETSTSNSLIIGELSDTVYKKVSIEVNKACDNIKFYLDDVFIDELQFAASVIPGNEGQDNIRLVPFLQLRDQSGFDVSNAFATIDRVEVKFF